MFLKLTQKKLILIVGIGTLIIVGGLIGVAWYYQMNREGVVDTNTANTNSITNTVNINDIDISNWQAYKDSNSGLSIRYPVGWVAVDTSYASKGFRPSTSRPADDEWAAIYVNFRPNEQMLEMEEYYGKATDFPNLYEEATSEEPRMIDGMLVTYFETIPGAVTNSALVASLGTWVVELQMHKDQIGEIEKIQDIFFGIIESINSASSTTPNSNVVTGDYKYYYHPDQPTSNYRLDDQDGVLYHYLSATAAEPIDIGVNTSLYHASPTRFGILLWKKGETKNTYFNSFGDQPIPYETGVKPNFLLFNTQTSQTTTLPEVSSWREGDLTFDRVYRVFSSINEDYLMIEIGEYNINAIEFEPGLIESQPVQSRSIVYDVPTNTFTEEDPISIFRAVHKVSTTNWNTISWDSKNNIIAAAPGGEGCGAYSTISFVKLDTKTEERVGSPEGSWGGYDYLNETCNPHNGASPSRKWLILWGKIEDGQYAYRLYAPETTTQVLKKVITNKAVSDGMSGYLISWDESNAYPIIKRNDEVVVDFNK